MERLGKKYQSVEALGWAARDSSGHLSPFVFSRRETGEEDVRVKVLYCGVCHSDLHCLKNEWHSSIYPLVPGHEIVGEVTEIGRKVSKFNIGDKIGVGCIVDSCRTCESCREDQENYCTKAVATYNGVHYDGTVNYGGYSDHIVVDERYAVKIPHPLPLASAAPLLCAGISMYSPMKYFGLAGPGKHVGIVGLGGLGHIGVRFAKAFGSKVTVVSSTAGKSKDALENFGADGFLVSTDEDQMQGAMGTMDGIIDTVSASHPILPLVGLLKPNGKLVLLGAMEKPFDLHAFSLILGRKSIAGSAIGGIKETQEMINFAAEHGIKAEIETISMEYVNTAMDRLAKGDVRYRFVIDIANTLAVTRS
ncbi:putative cinnamyl alcohol dehydrogenase 6 [Raphanus sativus]|uniref:Probable cinnamyl alcohol dehydrogenase 6 n=1 Tax=Raphanus sativus TaxID=3726 RepID=A0A6J0LHQ7_RAPSA|nr:probable cinnamyl alcohol dehydrogenase 6 [Raphanus sativus]KAJ4914091.1 putative cinnamyl alcohol dehydrogenase 6 [Raphanus sativus]